jgi:hypothetical protein
MRIPAWLSAAARPFHRERVSRVYLCLVGATLILLAVDTAFITHEDASFSGIWLVLVTLPWTPMLWGLFDVFKGTASAPVAYGWGVYAFGVGTAVLSALLNALLLGVAARALRRHRELREPR